ncbi:unnamed protein product [Closterium sp. NIES-54]
MSLCQRPCLHCVGRGRLAIHRRFGSGARSPLSVIPLRASSLLSLSVASSLASPPTPCPASRRTAMMIDRSSRFYHPASRCLLSSQDVTFDELVCFYCLHPHTSSPLSPSPLFVVPGPPPPVDPLPPQGPAL